MPRPRKAGPREPSGRPQRRTGEYKCVREWSDTMKPLVDSAPALFGSAVYVIQAEDTGVIKVGLCYDIADRITKLQSGHHETLLCYWAVRLSDKDALVVEKTFHQLCRGKSAHIRGEWYKCHPRVACNVIMQIIRKFSFNAQPDLNFGVGRF